MNKIDLICIYNHKIVLFQNSSLYHYLIVKTILFQIIKEIVGFLCTGHHNHKSQCAPDKLTPLNIIIATARKIAGP